MNAYGLMTFVLEIKEPLPMQTQKVKLLRTAWGRIPNALLEVDAYVANDYAVHRPLPPDHGREMWCITYLPAQAFLFWALGLNTALRAVEAVSRVEFSLIPSAMVLGIATYKAAEAQQVREAMRVALNKSNLFLIGQAIVTREEIGIPEATP